MYSQTAVALDVLDMRMRGRHSYNKQTKKF